HAVWPSIVWDESFLSILHGHAVWPAITVGTDLEGDGKKVEGSGNLKKTCLSTKLVETKFKGSKSGPFIVGDLEVLKLGKMVKDLNCINDEGSIWPLGYEGYKEVSFISKLSFLFLRVE
nr:histone-lysine N-methyltransferase ATX2-like isoform X1 [Tanacetum cinerariifolium]